MSLRSLPSSFGSALSWVVDEHLLSQRNLSLKDAFVFLWLAKNTNPLVPERPVVEGQRELAARIGISEPTLAKALVSLESGELISGLRTNGQGKKEFSVANIPASPLHFTDGKLVVAESVVFGEAAVGVSKSAQVMACMLVYLSDRVGLIIDKTESALSEVLNIEGKKLLRILRDLEHKGFLVFSRSTKRGFDFENDNRLVIKLSLPVLIKYGWNTKSIIIGVMNYGQFKEGQCPEGVSTQLNMLAKMGKDDELAKWLSVEYSFGSEYLLYPALLWPKKINLYCLNRPDGWVDTYENEHGFFPVEVLSKISNFYSVLIDELFLTLSAKLLAEFYFEILEPGDNVLNAACMLVKGRLKQYFIKPGYRDSSVEWVIEELAVCLIRQAQRGRELLSSSGVELSKAASQLECGRAFRLGKLNTYEVFWVVTNNLSKRQEVTFDLERFDGSVVI